MQTAPATLNSQDLYPFIFEQIQLKEACWINNEPCFTRRAIGEWLEYPQPNQAIKNIIKRSPYIDDPRWSSVVRLTTELHSGKGEQARQSDESASGKASIQVSLGGYAPAIKGKIYTREVEQRVYNPIGLQLIIFESRQPKAKAYKIMVANLVYAFMRGELKPPTYHQGLDDVIERIDATMSRLGDMPGKDAWFCLPETCREKGRELFVLVNRARDIRARAKKKGKTRAMKALAKKAGVSVATIYNHIRKADAALAQALKAGEDATFTQIEALSYRYGTSLNRFRAFDGDAIAFAVARYMGQEDSSILSVYNETIKAARANNWKAGSYDSLVTILKRASRAMRAAAQGKEIEAGCQTRALRVYRDLWPPIKTMLRRGQ